MWSHCDSNNFLTVVGLALTRDALDVVACSIHIDKQAVLGLMRWKQEFWTSVSGTQRHRRGGGAWDRPLGHTISG